MMFEYLSFKDGTELCYSQLLVSGKVLARFKRTKDGEYQLAQYELPRLARLSAEGFPEEKLRQFETYLKEHQRELFRAAANRLKESVGG